LVKVELQEQSIRPAKGIINSFFIFLMRKYKNLNKLNNIFFNSNKKEAALLRQPLHFLTVTLGFSGLGFTYRE
jgi:hypothetical protein